jgi:lipoate-protein ligase B
LEVEIYQHSLERPYSYRALNLHQQTIAQEIQEKGAPGRILLAEVAPVITYGRRTSLEKDLLFKKEIYHEKGIDLLEVDRGGLATFHGPGQWLLFIVEKLEVLTGDRKGVRKAVYALLEVTQRVSQKAGVAEAKIKEGCDLGLWSATGKLASVGVSVQGGVLLHGICLNVYPSPLSFFGLRPCGAEAQLDYLSVMPHEPMRTLMGQVGDDLISHSKRLLARTPAPMS